MVVSLLLAVLQLCYNKLTGSIPTRLGSLKKLSVLALQSNQLSGAIPASLGDLTMLNRLDLSFNSLFGSIPLKVAVLPLLKVLDIRNNTLSGNVPLGNQPFLRAIIFLVFDFITLSICFCGVTNLSLEETG